MKNKTFNIGEYCLHGTIRASLRDDKLTIEVCDYKTRNVQDKNYFHLPTDKMALSFYLEDFTTCFYADKIINHFYA